MMNLEDVKYICTNLANLSGIPVRLFHEKKQIFYCSVIQLPVDPFILNREAALSLENDVCYFEDSFGFYYGIVQAHDMKLVVGPTRQIPISKQELKSLAFSLGVSASLQSEFIAAMESLAAFPLMSLLQVLCMVCFSLTGEKKTLEDISIHEAEQSLLKEEIGKDDANRALESLEGYFNGPYNAFDTENRLMDMVMRGDVAALSDFISHIPAVRSGIVAQEQLRQSKNIFIVTATLTSRAAIRGGMDVTSALALSDTYIQKCEVYNSLDRITELQYNMVLDYAEKVAAIKLGQDPSVLVMKVANYVQ